MNREILFRGKREDGLGDWVYGCLIIEPDDTYWIDHYPAGLRRTTKVIPATVGQFTGVTDKNGVKIFEGDLLSDPFPIDEEDLSKGYYESFLPVVWCSKTLQWCVDASFAKDGSFLTSLVEYFGEFLEVKGNIYDNPELIK